MQVWMKINSVFVSFGGGTNNDNFAALVTWLEVKIL